MTAATVRPWRSLRWRLPVLVVMLIAASLSVFLWISERALEQVLKRAGGDRAQTAADQVANLMAQAVARGTEGARRVATDPAIAMALKDPSDANLEAAKRALAPLSAPGQPPTELWTVGESKLLEAASPRGPATPFAVDDARLPRPFAPGLSPFRMEHGAVIYSLTVEVPRHAGFIIASRTFNGLQTGDAIQRLVGGRASVLLGNQRGDVWTDLSKPAAGPAVNPARRGSASFRTANGEARLGALTLVANSPWNAWIDFPESAVLTPARTLMKEMLLLALVLVAISAVVVAVVSARITTPLQRLTHASTSAAAGRFDERVPDDRDDEIGRLGVAFNTMIEHVATAQSALERRVADRTSELEEAVRELEAFSYSVSHDLRAPLRHVGGFAALLAAGPQESLTAEQRRQVTVISEAAARMGRLIDDLLAFSRVSRTPLARRRVELARLVDEARREVPDQGPAVTWNLHGLPAVHGDPALLRLVLVNLFSNAVKYSSKQAHPIVEVGATRNGAAETIVFVRDNGDGFDMQYVDKLFGVFQRLHSREEFDGTGIGLANVRRIIQRHGGRTWAEGAVKGGATFYFSLPDTEAAT